MFTINFSLPSTRVNYISRSMFLTYLPWSAMAVRDGTLPASFPTGMALALALMVFGLGLDQLDLALALSVLALLTSLLYCRVHVVFGHVIEGQEVVREVERQKVDENSRPLVEVSISSCGELVLQVKPKGTTTTVIRTTLIKILFTDLNCCFIIVFVFV